MIGEAKSSGGIRARRDGGIHRFYDEAKDLTLVILFSLPTDRLFPPVGDLARLKRAARPDATFPNNWITFA